jgi:hypothetical protein
MLKGQTYVIACIVFTNSDYWIDNGFRGRNLEDLDTSMLLAKEDDDVWRSGNLKKKVRLSILFPRTRLLYRNHRGIRIHVVTRHVGRDFASNSEALEATNMIV